MDHLLIDLPDHWLRPGSGSSAPPAQSASRCTPRGVVASPWAAPVGAVAGWALAARYSQWFAVVPASLAAESQGLAAEAGDMIADAAAAAGDCC